MTGILFIARLGSTRLERKHLIKVGEFSFLEWLIKRFEFGFHDTIIDGQIKLFIATSDHVENKEFERFQGAFPVTVFYGDATNIPKRMAECAVAFDLDNIIAIDGDDILCSTEAACLVYKTLESDPSAQYVVTTGLPLGMNVSGFKKNFLVNAVKNSGDGKLETGWARIFDNSRQIKLSMGAWDDRNLRFTLDYPPDAAFFTSIINNLENRIISISDTDLIQFVKEKELFKLNENISEEYWRNFNKQIANEG